MWTWRLTLSKIKINTAGCLYFVCTCLYRSLFRLYLKQLNKKWKIKNGQRATLKFFYFIYAIRKRIVCTRSYLSYFRLYLKGFGDTAISKFHKCVKRVSRSFLKISKWDQRHSKENHLYLSYFRLYLKGFGDTAISKFQKCAKRGSPPFLKISLLLIT